jgi:hypothetical protein
MVGLEERRDSHGVERVVSLSPRKEKTSMHDLIVALVFIAMMMIPCAVASFSGSTEA